MFVHSTYNNQKAISIRLCRQSITCRLKVFLIRCPGLLQAGGSGSSTDATQVHRDMDLSPGQPFQLNQSSAGLGVIGRRSVPDLLSIGDNLSGSTVNTGVMHEQLYNLQMLDAAYYRLPQSKDSERLKNYTPVCELSYFKTYLHMENYVVLMH